MTYTDEQLLDWLEEHGTEIYALPGWLQLEMKDGKPVRCNDPEKTLRSTLGKLIQRDPQYAVPDHGPPEQTKTENTHG